MLDYQLGGTESYRGGTVFMLKPTGAAWQFTDLYNFSIFSGGYEAFRRHDSGCIRKSLWHNRVQSAFPGYGTVFELSRK